MSIIERAASKISTPEVAPLIPAISAEVTPPEEQEQAQLREAIDRVEASFSPPAEPKSTPVWKAPPRATDDGPPTIISQKGFVDLERLKAMGALTPDAGRSKLAEECRLIKRPLIANAFGQGDAPPLRKGNMIMVTSSLPSEGKSFTSINLALSIASELESTVLLVDADVSKTAVMRYLGLQGDRGLLDVLRDPSIPLSDVLIKTNISKLTVLPSGRGVSHSTELLASSAMQNFVDDIATRYPDRIVIFDTPPLLSTSEASVLATYMGQVVFVVEAERTPQDAVREALSLIDNHQFVGMVLNKAPSRAGGADYYGYGYGYGYGSYGEHEKS